MQYHEYGVNQKMPLLGAFASSLLNPDILPQLGDKALGIHGPSAYSPALDNPINKSAVARWKKKHRTPPSDSFMVGGTGSIPGAALASLLVGLLDTFSKVFFPGLAYFAVYLALVVVLLFRPSGLMGRR